MTQIEARSDIRITRPAREGNGWSRDWTRIIAGVLYGFTAVVMPITGDLRYYVTRFDGDPERTPKFGHEWKRIHEIIVKAQPLHFRMTRPGLYAAGDVEIIRDATASPDNRWQLRYPGRPVTAHRLLKSAQSVAKNVHAVRRAEALITRLDHESYPGAEHQAEAELMNTRFDRFAAINAAARAKQQHPEQWPAGTPVLFSNSSRGGHPLNLLPATITANRGGVMTLTVQGAGDQLVGRNTYIERDTGTAPAEPVAARLGEQSTDLTGARCYDETPHAGHRIVGSMRGSCKGIEAQPVEPAAPPRRYTAAEMNIAIDQVVETLRGGGVIEGADSGWTAVTPAGNTRVEHNVLVAAMVRGYLVQHPTNSRIVELATGENAPTEPATDMPYADMSVADAVAKYYRTHARQWPTPSQLVRGGVDFNTLHVAEGAGDVERYELAPGRAVYRLPVPDPAHPIEVGDVVTLDPHRESRQFDVIAVDELDTEAPDSLVRVSPRRPLHLDDGLRWESRKYALRVPGVLIERVEADDDTDVEYGPIDKAAVLRKPIDSLLHSGTIGEATSEIADCGGLVVQRNDGERLHVDPVPSAGIASHREADCDEPGGEDEPTDLPPVPSGPARTPADVAAWLAFYAGHEGHGSRDVWVRRESLREWAGILTPAPSVADLLLPAMPKQYADALSYLLRAHGFTAPAGIDRLVPDESNPEAFLIHDPTGLAVGVYERTVRLSYFAAHGGAPDEDGGPAWIDLDYGTSFETVVDVAVGLVQRLMRKSHLSHMRAVAQQLRAFADQRRQVVDKAGAQTGLMIRRDELHALADQLAAEGTECKAAGYARRVTAVFSGLLSALVAESDSMHHTDGLRVRTLVLRAAEAVQAPEPTVEDFAAYIGAGADAAIVADDSVPPADVDALVESMLAAGWQLAAEPEFVLGKRVRYLAPPAAVDVEPPLPQGPPVPFKFCKLHGADCRSAQNGRPCSGMTDEPYAPSPNGSLVAAGGWCAPAPEMRSPYVGEGADGARRSAEIDRTEADTHETASPEWLRCIESGSRWETQADYLDQWPAGATPFDPGTGPIPGFVAGECGHRVAGSEWMAGLRTCEHCPADEPDTGGTAEGEIVDAGGFLACGCHGSQRDHTCGPSEAPDPAAEV